MRWVKKLQNNVSIRLPITASILKQLRHVFNNGVFSPFLGLMLKCMFSLPFFGSVFDLVKLLVKKQILNISKKINGSFEWSYFVKESLKNMLHVKLRKNLSYSENL